MSDTLPQITRVDLTERDRKILVKVFDVVSSIMLLRNGIVVITPDNDPLEWLHENAEEVLAFVVKFNRDRLSPRDKQLAEKIIETEAQLVKFNFERIKHTMEETKKRNPAVAANSPLRRDMEWLLTELEKRL